MFRILCIVVLAAASGIQFPSALGQNEGNSRNAAAAKEKKSEYVKPAVRERYVPAASQVKRESRYSSSRTSGGAMLANMAETTAIVRRAWFETQFGCGPESVLPGSFTKYLPVDACGSKYGGVSYYQYCGVFFTPVPGGYVVTTPPAILPQPVVIQEELPYELQGQIQSQNLSQETINPQRTEKNSRRNGSAGSDFVTVRPSRNQTASPAPQKQSETFNVHLSNSNGTFTVVPILKTENGYVGPLGELYQDYPSVEILKAKYSKED